MSSKLESWNEPHVVVLGTLNIDHVWIVAELPRPGQTILARSSRREFGGKGANQAVAAARQGARVTLVGAVGSDADGSRYRSYLDREGIDTGSLFVHADAATGAAHVYVDDRGENLIVVDAGANDLLDPALLERTLVAPLAAGAVLLAQLEAPTDAISAALQVAASAGARTLLNASPFRAGYRWPVEVDTVIVNEHECRDCFDIAPQSLVELGAAARRQLFAHHRLKSLVITQGAAPTLYVAENETHIIPAFPVTPIDTVGAGDTFAGSLAVELARRIAWPDALRHANVAAALSTLSVGAQTAMPGRATVLANLPSAKRAG